MTLLLLEAILQKFHLKSFLHTQFHTKDLGMLKCFLGVKIPRSRKDIFLSQRKYELNLLVETGNIGVKPCSVLMISSSQHTKDGELFKDFEKYKKLVVKLNYLIVPCPYIAYFVSVVISKYCS